jgi:hypothetical protein
LSHLKVAGPGENKQGRLPGGHPESTAWHYVRENQSEGVLGSGSDGDAGTEESRFEVKVLKYGHVQLSHPLLCALLKEKVSKSMQT